MSNWIYKEEINPEKYYGFVYKIINLETSKYYIGKKAFFHNKKKKLTKKEIAEQVGRGRKAVTKVEQINSGWEDYWGSSKELLKDVKELGKDKFRRIILKLVYTKKQLTFYEAKQQIEDNVLFMDSYNDNILGKFFRKDFEEPKN